MHTKPKKVKCEECGCYFIRKALLDRHIAKMHGTTNLPQEVVVIKAFNLPEAKTHRSASSRACVADKNTLKAQDASSSALFSFFSVCTRFSVFNLLDLAFGDCFC
jgi:hypothetical protein